MFIASDDPPIVADTTIRGTVILDLDGRECELTAELALATSIALSRAAERILRGRSQAHAR